MVSSDEMTFKYDLIPAQQHVRYKKGQGLRPTTVRKSFKSGRTSINVWGAIQKGSRSDLVWIKRRTGDQLRKRPKSRPNKGGLDAQQYTKLIVNGEMSNYMSRCRPDSVLQQDNFGPHRTKMALAAIEAYNIKLTAHPANSPDLQGIETMWRIVKAATRKYYSKRPYRPHSKEELFEDLRKQWWAIPQWKINKIFNTYPQRHKDVADAGGGHTKW